MVVMLGKGGKGEGRVDGSEVGRLERGWEGEIVKEEIATESYYAKSHLWHHTISDKLQQ